MHSSRIATAVLALAVATGATATAAPRAGTLIWLSGRDLRRRPLAGGQATTLATLPVDPSRVRRIDIASDGSAVLLDLGGPAAWLDLTAAPPHLTWLPCHGTARLHPTGGLVACTTRGGIARLRLRPRAIGALVAGAAPEPAAFADPAGQSVIARDGDALLRRTPGAPDVPLATAPTAILSIAPDGGRAVGSFAEPPDEAASLYTFRLDGKGTRRKLLPGTPITWSADSAWLLIDTDIAACAVRAVGGQYKCWDGFRSRALDPVGRRALLARDHPGGGVDLFIASVEGAFATKPIEVAAGIAGSGAAALAPGQGIPASGPADPTPEPEIPDGE